MPLSAGWIRTAPYFKGGEENENKRPDSIALLSHGVMIVVTIMAVLPFLLVFLS